MASCRQSSAFDVLAVAVDSIGGNTKESCFILLFSVLPILFLFQYRKNKRHCNYYNENNEKDQFF